MGTAHLRSAEEVTKDLSYFALSTLHTHKKCGNVLLVEQLKQKGKVMDPNVVLKRLLAWANRSNADVLRNEAELAAEDFRALDDWMTNGGFMPEAWTTVLVHRNVKFEVRNHNVRGEILVVSRDSDRSIRVSTNRLGHIIVSSAGDLTVGSINDVPCIMVK